ncbi:MAG: hypothetical protein J1F09_07790 [Oscillospiraceae bacterium]|nr:hypothetical protein [Oscillospiraceae bacterium]
MRFEEQYKKEINEISPSEEQLERIRTGVMRKLQKKKKPLYLRIAAISGASAAALVIVAAAVFALPRGKNNMSNLLGNSPNNVEMNGNAAADFEPNGGAASEGNNIFDFDFGNLGDGLSHNSTDKSGDGAEPDNPGIGNSASQSASQTADSPFLEWLSDGKQCTLTTASERRFYAPAGAAPLPENAKLVKASTPDGDVRVHFDDRELWVIFPDGRPAEHYTIIMIDIIGS